MAESRHARRPRRGPVWTALLVGLPVFARVGEHLHGRRVLGRTLARLEAQGETLDVSRLFPRPEASAERASADLLAAAQDLPTDNPPAGGTVFARPTSGWAPRKSRRR